jgi:hypothetical protein
MKTKLVCAFLLLSALPAVAATTFVEGHGTDSCAEFLQARTISPTVEDSYWFWTEGFMSGMNTMLLAAKSPGRNLSATSQDDQRKAVRDYCSSNPNTAFETAVVKILFTFPEAPAASK